MSQGLPRGSAQAHAAPPQAVDLKPLELDVDAEPACREIAGGAEACVVATMATVSIL